MGGKEGEIRRTEIEGGGGGHALWGNLFNEFELALVARTQILMISL